MSAAAVTDWLNEDFLRRECPLLTQSGHNVAISYCTDASKKFAINTT